MNQKHPSYQPGDTVGYFRLIYKGNRQKRTQQEAIWLCRCRCLTIKEVREAHLRCRPTISCGCLRREIQGRTYYKHGRTKTAEFRILNGIRQRCLNPNDPRYVDYGG